uniref:Zinc finger HIT-type containing 2 n=1 Tax=Leptobrachium leishanense TaxID=445787 RepID=A0A8C5R5U3_9ANUR
MAAPSPDILVPTRGVSPAAEEESGDGGRTVCSLCLSRPGIYTCPRCNAPYCSLACYRGPRHTACSEDFYRESVLRVLREEEEARPHGRRRMEEMLLKLEEGDPGEHWLEMVGEEAGLGGTHPPCEEEAGLGGTHPPCEEEAALWKALTPRERQDFHRLVKSGEIGALLPEWTPWWATAKRTKKTNCVIMELPSEGKSDKNHENRHLQEENYPPAAGGSTNDRTPSRNQQEKATLCLQTVSGESEQAVKSSAIDGKPSIGIDSSTSDHDPSDLEANLQNFAVESSGQAKLVPRRGQRVRIKEEALEEDGPADVSQDGCSGVPPLFSSIPSLTSLCRSPSPMVRFSVVNALYGYAFSLLRHHGDLSDEDILLDFIGTLLYISGGLGSTIIYNSTSHALQSAVRAASDPMSGGDQVGACSAMEATSQILEGDGSNTYSLAALTHTSRILGKAQKFLSEDKQTRRRVFNAKKKCMFLAAWVNENSECLPTLSKAVKQEHEQHLRYINGMTKITTGLQKVWGGKRPPVNKALIEEISPEATQETDY